MATSSNPLVRITDAERSDTWRLKEESQLMDDFDPGPPVLPDHAPEEPPKRLDGLPGPDPRRDLLSEPSPAASVDKTGRTSPDSSKTVRTDAVTESDLRHLGGMFASPRACETIESNPAKPHQAPEDEPPWCVDGATDGWPNSERLGEELPTVPQFDSGVLPASLRPMVEDVADRTQVPLDFPAIVAVATLAGLCGRRALIQPKKQDVSWVVVPNLWGAIVADPGMMKSPVIATVTAPARAVEAEWRAGYAEAMREYEAASERAKLDHAVWAESYKRASKKGDVLPSKPQTNISNPLQRRLIAVDATFESLHQLLAENPAGLFVLRDELTGWLASLERQGRESERAFYLECWSGDTRFTIDRIGRGSIHVEHCCGSLFGGIQPGRFRAYLSDALRDGPANDGLIQRFQLLVWPDAKKDWSYRDRAPDARAMKMAERVYRRIAEMNSERPLRLNFASDAQALFIEWLTDLETRLRADGLSPFVQAHLAKYRKLMPALSLLLSLADNSLEAVRLHHAQQAADLCEYLGHHARRVYASRISPERLAALSLSRRLTAGWKRDSGIFTVRDVYQNDWTGLGTPDEVRAAVRVLEDACWVRAEKAKPDTGRPSEVYAINPRIGGLHVGD